MWKKQFSTLLQGDDDTNTGFRDVALNPIDDDGVEIPPFSYEEVKVAITWLKNNKVAGPDGLPAELFTTACNELVVRMHQLIYKIWLEESMSNDWNLRVLCPVLKKADPTICANYRDISRLPIAYKVLTLVGPYQSGFRPGKCTINQIFMKHKSTDTIFLSTIRLPSIAS